MRNEYTHLTDKQLLLVVDGELSTRRAAQVRAHLAACWDCRARMGEIEATIADFTRTHRQGLNSSLPPISGARAQLKAQLAEIAIQSNAESRRSIFRFSPLARAGLYLCITILMTAVAGRWLFQHFKLSLPSSAIVSSSQPVVPNSSLTPGATRQVAIGDVCSMAQEEVVKPVPASLRHKVFQEYGIGSARADDYEVDFLIAPGLGGAEDIHNLWPEPNTSTLWNAHVKDTLEERLHELVCLRKLDLSTAQHDIATDWIAAYKKYFHTENAPGPIALSLPASVPGRAFHRWHS
jgi:hypothetical protein